MNRNGSRQRKDHDSKVSLWHRAAVLTGWQRKLLDGKLVYIREDATTEVPNSYEIADSVETACLGSRLSDLGEIKLLLRKFSN